MTEAPDIVEEAPGLDPDVLRDAEGHLNPALGWSVFLATLRGRTKPTISPPWSSRFMPRI